MWTHGKLIRNWAHANNPFAGAFVAVWLIGVALSACQSGEPSKVTLSAADLIPLCASDAECADLEFCRDAVCTPRRIEIPNAADTPMACLDNGDCIPGFTCRESLCVATSTATPPCREIDDCRPFATVCDLGLGICRPCSADLPCAEQMRCGEDSKCYAATNDRTSQTTPNHDNPPSTPVDELPDSECSFHSDCDDNWACFEGDCQPCFTDQMCRADSIDPSLCDFSTGSCKLPDCAWAEDCEPGDGCWRGRCGPCTTHEDCRSGETCGPSRSCHPAPENECDDQTPCTQGRACLPDGSCGACQSDDECSSPQRCTAGRCLVPECAESTECANGQVCEASLCVNCQRRDQCAFGEVCSGDGRCVLAISTAADLGETCAENTACSPGLDCITVVDTQVCARTCIGSGKTMAADCPPGFACYKFGSDTFSLCLPAEIMLSAAGERFPGHPFTSRAGSTCAEPNSCQTGFCEPRTSRCLRHCQASADCNDREVCYTAWTETREGSDTALGYEINDIHHCIGSEPGRFSSYGAECSAGLECDSGLCIGTCTNNSELRCNYDFDCPDGGMCNGFCGKHCRSGRDCPADAICDVWPTLLPSSGANGFTKTCSRRTGLGTEPLGATCGHGSDCLSNWCVGGKCSTTCANVDDCPAALSTPGSPARCETDAEFNAFGFVEYATQVCRTAR